MVRIITDSAADLEPREYEALGITCIPLKVMFGDTEYEENVNLTKDQFFELLKSTGESPKTAQPAPSYLMDFFADEEDLARRAIPENDDEYDILRVYRLLDRRAKHEFMSMVYDFENKAELKGDNSGTDSAVG